MKKTENDRIFIAQQSHIDESWLDNAVEALVQSAFDESADIKRQVQALVPEYVPQNDRAPVGASEK